MADDAPDHIGVAEDDAEFEVACESLVGEVRAAYQRYLLVGGDEFRVQGGP